MLVVACVVGDAVVAGSVVAGMVLLLTVGVVVLFQSSLRIL